MSLIKRKMFKGMSFSGRSNDLIRLEVEGWRCADWTEKSTE